MAMPEIKQWAQGEEPQFERFKEYVRSLGIVRRPRP
jgi:hypothetical protein